MQAIVWREPDQARRIARDPRAKFQDCGHAANSKRALSLCCEAAALRSAYGLHETLPESLLFSRHHLELGADGALVQTHQGGHKLTRRCRCIFVAFSRNACIAGFVRFQVKTCSGTWRCFLLPFGKERRTSCCCWPSLLRKFSALAPEVMQRGS